MDKLLVYINSLPLMERELFAARCETTVGYLRKACSIKQKLSESICLRIAAESDGTVTPSDLRPDVDWSRMRIALNQPELATQPQPTTQEA
jgi:DNA-binding transcriptional regulator YdaS (Cro superfamily)